MSRRTTSFLAALALAAATLVATGPAEAGRGGHGHDKCRNITDVDRVLKCVTLRGVMEHVGELQRIADRNDGNRAAGTSGYDDSVRYVKKRLKRAGYKVRLQEFDFFKFSEVGPSALEQVAPTPTTYVEDTDFAATPQSEEGDVTAAVTPVDLQLGLGNTSSSGCEASDFAGFPSGNIALIQRGTCTFEIKGENAAAAGASAILFFNQGDTAAEARQGIPSVTLGNGYTGGIPALSATYPLGEQLAGTPGLTLRLFANVSRVPATTVNVLADSKWGDRDHVVVVGAHLDSVPEGAGMSDNATGSATLIEVAEQLSRTKTQNRLRFAWWGAEEAGLVGSTHYVTDLAANDPDGLADLELYLNFDMIGSPNYGLFRLDGDGSDFGTAGPDGSDEIEHLFTRFYEDVREVPTEASAFDGRSDYQPFINNGVPAGGLRTGSDGIKTAAQVAKWGGTAGIQYDPCYHSACDDIDNISREALEINADGVAYAVYLFASGEEVLND